MKRALLLTGALLALTSAAFAFPDKETKGAKKEVACAVMTDHKVNIKEATTKKMFTDYKGNRYFFCCAGCSPSFKSDPAKYAEKAESIPTPKATPKKKKG